MVCSVPGVMFGQCVKIEITFDITRGSIAIGAPLITDFPFFCILVLTEKPLHMN